ncbi:isocitrate lyase/phosphoenolpyruvate mutase family protein [Amycolatopsis sp. DSM 110486]|nr:isocitrate lyase/phosphoenolpyruvate mutase family protein [Amycolatopsis sp. DSM 110486]
MRGGDPGSHRTTGQTAERRKTITTPDTTQHARYEQFLELHRGPEAFIMPNAWDAPSALLFKEAGFAAVATSSAAFAATLGRLDGIHAVSRDKHVAHAALLTSVSGLPINGDFEDGYGETPEDVRATVDAAIARGLAGIGIEDTTGDPSQPIREFDDAVRRIEAAAAAAHGRIVLTGRTDNFLWGISDIGDTIRPSPPSRRRERTFSTHRTCRTGPPSPQSSRQSRPSRSTSSSAPRTRLPSQNSRRSVSAGSASGSTPTHTPSEQHRRLRRS